MNVSDSRSTVSSGVTITRSTQEIGRRVERRVGGGVLDGSVNSNTHTHLLVVHELARDKLQSS